jgi:protein involved in polysaccharide export with SLBB domain
MDRWTAEPICRRLRLSKFGYVAVVAALTCVAGAGCYAPIHSRGIEARTLSDEFRWPMRTAAAPLNYSQLVGPAPAVYELGTGDRLEVTVADLISRGNVHTFQVQVLDNGEIHLPRSGPVVVGGMSLAEAQQRVNDVLMNNGLLQNPDAVVTLLEKGTVNVLVLGAVEQPGVHALPRYENDVAHALAAAQGFAEDAGDIIEIHRRSPILNSVPATPGAHPDTEILPDAELLPAPETLRDPVPGSRTLAQPVSAPLVPPGPVNLSDALSRAQRQPVSAEVHAAPSQPRPRPTQDNRFAPPSPDSTRMNWAPRPQRAAPAGRRGNPDWPAIPRAEPRTGASFRKYDVPQSIPASSSKVSPNKSSRYSGHSRGPVFRGQSPSNIAGPIVSNMDVRQHGSPITRIPLRGGYGIIAPGDVVLHAGDVLVVPRKTDKVFYVVGPLSDRNSVRFSVNDRDREIGGGLLLPDDREIDVVTAVVMAGYIDPINSPTTVTLHRVRPDGSPLLIVVDLIAARHDPLENVLVEPGDIIYLNPDSWWYLRRTFDQIIDRGLGTAVGRWLTN